MGAASLKGSVYILPDTEDHLEALHWLTGEVAGLGGEAAFVKVECIQTMGDAEIMALFNAQRKNDYAPIEADLEALEVKLGSLEQQDDPKGIEKVTIIFHKMLKDYRGIQAIDFFHSPQGSDLQEQLERFEERFKKLTAPPQVERPKSPGPKRKEDYQERVWVTRKNPFVDRMSSAWLIRRFIDPRARFELLDQDRMLSEFPNAVTFDVPGGDFSHQQDQCTFEVLVETFRLRGKALRKIAEVVHELDLKDGKFPNPLAGGVESILFGLRKTATNDREALEEGIKVFERLYEGLSK